MDNNKLAIVQGLINTAAFIKITLEDLQDTINREGCIDEYKHGENQKGLKQSAAASAHIAMTRNLTVIMKQLLDHVPAEKRKESKLAAMRGV